MVSIFSTSFSTAPFSSFAMDICTARSEPLRSPLYSVARSRVISGQNLALFPYGGANMSNKSLQIGLLSLCLTIPTYAATHHSRNVKVVDVNAHALPPLPSSRHVVVVNSAQNAPPHHGVAGMFQRL